MLLDVWTSSITGRRRRGRRGANGRRKPQPPLALGKVAAQAGGEGAFLDENRTTCLSVSRAPRNPAVLPSDRPEEGTMADAAESRIQVSRRATRAGQVSAREPRGRFRRRASR